MGWVCLVASWGCCCCRGLAAISFLWGAAVCVWGAASLLGREGSGALGVWPGMGGLTSWVALIALGGDGLWLGWGAVALGSLTYSLPGGQGLPGMAFCCSPLGCGLGSFVLLEGRGVLGFLPAYRWGWYGAVVVSHSN